MTASATSTSELTTLGGSPFERDFVALLSSSNGDWIDLRRDKPLRPKVRLQCNDGGALTGKWRAQSIAKAPRHCRDGKVLEVRLHDSANLSWCALSFDEPAEVFASANSVHLLALLRADRTLRAKVELSAREGDGRKHALCGRTVELDQNVTPVYFSCPEMPAAMPVSAVKLRLNFFFYHPGPFMVKVFDLRVCEY